MFSSPTLQINDFLISKDELSHRIALVGATTSMLAGGLVILGFMYHYYAPYASCGLNIFFITWTLIMALIYVALSVRSLLDVLTELPALSNALIGQGNGQLPSADWQCRDERDESQGIPAGVPMESERCWAADSSDCVHLHDSVFPPGQNA